MNAKFALFVFAILFCLISLNPNLSQASSQSERRIEAAEFYDAGDYKAAYKRYYKMAKDGDTFAQYRVSFMRLTGLGTREKVEEAMAWAVMAAQSGDAELAKYRDAVAKLVPVKKRKSAERKAVSYMRRWGTVSGPAGASKVECTGSRLMRNCYAEGATPTVRIAWSDDLSEQPEQRDRIDKLNQAIVSNFSGT